MHRIDTPDVDTNKHGSGKNGFKDGAAPGSSATSLDADAFDSYQEEIARVVEAGGETLLKTDLGQMIDAIKFLIHTQALMAWQERTSTGTDTVSVATDDIDAGDVAVVMGNATNGQRSVDGGLTWANVTCQSQTTEQVSYGNSQYIAVGSGSVNIQSSSTGASGAWTSENTGTGQGRDVEWNTALALWCVVGSDTGPWIVTSANGLTWAVQTPVGSDILNGIASNGTIWVAVGENGRIQTATVATGTWTARTAAASYSDNFNDVIWTGEVFVAVGDNDGVQTSPDGITWTSIDIAGSGTNEHISIVGGIVVIQNTLGLQMNHHKCSGPWLTAPAAGVPDGATSTAIAISMAMCLGQVIACTSANKIYTANPFGPA